MNLADRTAVVTGAGSVLWSHVNDGGFWLIGARRTRPMPRGLFNFEDPPVHTIHRGLLSRVFAPGRMAKLEDRKSVV